MQPVQPFPLVHHRCFRLVSKQSKRARRDGGLVNPPRRRHLPCSLGVNGPEFRVWGGGREGKERKRERERERNCYTYLVYFIQRFVCLFGRFVAMLCY